MATKKSTNTKTKASTAKSSTAKAETKTKEPLVSTKRKVGIAIYFTFIITLALSFGAQVWMMETFNPPATNEPNLASNEQTQSPNTTQESPQFQNDESNIERALLENEQQEEFIVPAPNQFNFYDQNENLIAQQNAPQSE